MADEVIFFSDSHISKYTGLFHEKVFNMGVKLVNEILNARPNAFLLHLGDITDSGTYEDFLYAKNVLDANFSNIERFYTIPGNHDMRNIGYQLWKDFFGERQFFIDTREDGGNMLILGIDSSEPDANTGMIGDRGIEAICELAKYPEDMVKILCFHHHFLPIPNTGRERAMVLDAGDVREVIWDAGIDIIVTAHRHYPNVFSLSNGDRRLLLINSGTFSSFKTRGRAGHTFVHLKMNENRIKLKFMGIEAYSEFLQPAQFTQGISNGEITTYSPYVLPEDKILTKICQFSDTHFTNGNDFLPEVYDLGIKMMVREKPNLLAHCGDLTNDSYPEDFALAKMRLRELRESKIPYLIVPGKRDLQPFGREMFIEQIGPLDPIFEDPTVRVVGINTGPDDSGHVGRSRLKMIQRDFHQYGSYKFFVVVMHHSTLPIPRAKFKRSVQDAGDVISFLTGNQVPLVLSGFEHYATTLQVENTVFVNSGTFSSRKIRSRRLNTFVVITVYESGMMLVEEIEIHSGSRHRLGIFRVPLIHMREPNQ